MGRKTLHFLLLATLVAVSSLALADPPARVGRISAVEGKVTLLTNGEEEGGNLLNWPVTTENHVTTAPGARAEFRVGSAAIRLDGDSDLEVEVLDDDQLRLRLNYGTASVRLREREMLNGFELSTPQARIVLTEPGAVRVDTERAPDTTTVNVLAGTARVDGAGNVLTARVGKRVDVRGDEVTTSLAVRDRFDDWAQTRDRHDEGLVASRYVPADVTGYEELDQYGSWSDTQEYGVLWSPRVVPAGWAPYRDGRWVWIAPWGWTWIDSAPWGYAPSHYGRWVTVGGRWCWAPGRVIGRAVWAPALVGWVGGNGWSATFGSRTSGPAVGWYPLSPHDRYIPTYRISSDYERRLVWNHRSQDNWQERHRDRDHDGRRDGVTVLPRDHFEQHRSITVATVPKAMLTPAEVRAAPSTAAPAPVSLVTTANPRPAIGRNPEWRDQRDERSNRNERVLSTGRSDDRDSWRNHPQRNDQRSQPVQPTPPAQLQAAPAAVVAAPAPQQQGILSTQPPPMQPARPQYTDDRSRFNRDNEMRDVRRRERDDDDRRDGNRHYRLAPQPATQPPAQLSASPTQVSAPPAQFNAPPVQMAPARPAFNAPPAASPAPAAAPAMQVSRPQPAPAPQQQAAPQPKQHEHRERLERGDKER